MLALQQTWNARKPRIPPHCLRRARRMHATLHFFPPLVTLPGSHNQLYKSLPISTDKLFYFFFFPIFIRIEDFSPQLKKCWTSEWAPWFSFACFNEDNENRDDENWKHTLEGHFHEQTLVTTPDVCTGLRSTQQCCVSHTCTASSEFVFISGQHKTRLHDCENDIFSHST